MMTWDFFTMKSKMLGRKMHMQITIENILRLFRKNKEGEER